MNLDPDTHRCRIWGDADYSQVCRAFRAEPAVCGESRDEALMLIAALEIQTSGGSGGDPA